MTSLYVAGPMTGYPDFNVPAFKAAKLNLEAKGFQIKLPVDIENTKEGWLWGDYLGEDIKVLCNECEGIVLLPEWERSRGAKLELAAALMQSLKYPDFEFYEYSKGTLTELSNERIANIWYRSWDCYSKVAKIA